MLQPNFCHVCCPKSKHRRVLNSEKNFLTVKTRHYRWRDVRLRLWRRNKDPVFTKGPWNFTQTKQKHGKFTLKARLFESVENSQEISLAQLRAFPKNAFCKGSQNWGGGPLGVVYWECKEQLRGGQGRRSARQWNTSFIDNVRKVFGQPLHDVTSKVFIHQSVEAQIEFCSLLCLSRWTPS